MWLALLFTALAADVERRQVGQLVLEGVPETPTDVAERLRQTQNVRSASLVGFAADGKSLFVATRFGETDQLHQVRSPGAARTQLTFFDEPIRGALPSPEDAGTMLLSRDVGGDEEYQIWRMDLASGALTQLSEGPGRATDAAWSHDGALVAWTQTLPGTAKSIVVADPSKPESRRTVWTGEGEWRVEDWAPDAKRLLLHEYVSISESRLHLLDVATGKLVEPFRSKTPVSWTDARFTPDGQSVLAVGDRGADQLRLWELPLGKGKEKLLTEAIKEEIDDLELSPDGAYVVFTTNVDGKSSLHLHDRATWNAVPLPSLPTGVISGLTFDPAGERLAFTHDQPVAPADVFSFELGETELVRWTHSELGGLDPSKFVQPEFVRFPSFDQREIPAFVYRPKASGPRPVIIAIHGGPEGQSRPSFNAVHQLWADLGYAVVVPNVRGSTGFGRSYHQLDNGLKRKDSVADIGALLDWIGTQPGLDAKKVVVYGGSYGGYMVLASLVDYADRLAGGVDIVGISDFETFLTNTRDYRRDLRRAEYGDERDPKVAAFFDQISPLNNAAKITSPLFVIQGANDPRVPASEAEQIAKAVRGNGTRVWTMTALDEGHGFRKKANRDAMAEAVVLFFDEVFGP